MVVEKNENDVPREPSEKELEVAAANGLAQIRRYGVTRYGLVAVALKDNERKCSELAAFSEELKANKIPHRLESKSSVIALYRRIA